MSASTTTTPATTPAATPATVPASQVIPFPLPWGGIPGCAPGCVPAGGMDALMKCYMDIKAAMGFIGKVMIDLINNDPAVAQAMIAAIQKSGTSLPLLGVTNGADAQPGQVGEWVMFQQSVAYPVSATQVQTSASMGVLQPGDWNVWLYAIASTAIELIEASISPLPAGFTSDLDSAITTGAAQEIVFLVSTTGRALISVPTLVPISLGTISTAAGNATLQFMARRMR